jgi:hypothetical protein
MRGAQGVSRLNASLRGYREIFGTWQESPPQLARGRWVFLLLGLFGSPDSKFQSRLQTAAHLAAQHLNIMEA